MQSDRLILLCTGAIGVMLGLGALLADVTGVAAVLCGLVFALAALCLFTGWRFWSESPVTRYDSRERVEDTRFE